MCIRAVGARSVAVKRPRMIARPTFRRGKALMELNEFAASKADLVAASKLDPKSREVRRRATAGVHDAPPPLPPPRWCAPSPCCCYAESLLLLWRRCATRTPIARSATLRRRCGPAPFTLLDRHNNNRDSARQQQGLGATTTGAWHNRHSVIRRPPCPQAADKVLFSKMVKGVGGAKGDQESAKPKED